MSLVNHLDKSSSNINNLSSSVYKGTIPSAKTTPVINIVLTANTDIATISTKIDYTLTITNTGTIDVTNVIVNCDMAEGLSSSPDKLEPFPSFSPPFDLAASADKVITFTAYVIYLPSGIPVYSSTPSATYNYLSGSNTLTGSATGKTLGIASNSSILNPLTGDFEETTYKNTPVTGIILAITPTNFDLIYTLGSLPKNGYVEVSTNGIWTYTPKVGFIGKDTFSVLITDAGSGSATSNVTITVKERPQSLDDLQCCKK